MELIAVGILLLLGIAAALWPLLGRDSGAPDAADAAIDRGLRDDEIAREVARFRTALRAGTICHRCAQANPAGSRFCADCGRPLREARTAPTSADA